jgi:hypothetical protein
LRFLVLLGVTFRFFDDKGEAEESGLEAFWRVGVELFEYGLETGSRGF